MRCAKRAVRWAAIALGVGLLGAVACTGGASPTATPPPPSPSPAAANPTATIAPTGQGTAAAGGAGGTATGPGTAATMRPGNPTVVGNTTPGAGGTTTTPGTPASTPRPAGSGTPAATNGTRTFKNDKLGFSVDLPGDWTEQDLSAGSTPFNGVAYNRPDNQGGLAVVTQTGTTPDELLATFESLLMGANGTGAQQTGSGTASFANENWKVVNYTAKTNGADGRARFWAAKHGDKVWLLIGAGLETTWAQDQEVLDQATRSFKFLQ